MMDKMQNSGFGSFDSESNSFGVCVGVFPDGVDGITSYIDEGSVMTRYLEPSCSVSSSESILNVGERIRPSSATISWLGTQPDKGGGSIHQEAADLFDIVHLPDSHDVFIRPKFGLSVCKGNKPTRLLYSGSFISPRFKYGEDSTQVALFHAYKWLVSNFRLVASKASRGIVEGRDRRIRTFSIAPSDNRNGGEDIGPIAVDFGGKQFILDPARPSQGVIAKEQLERFLASASDKDDGDNVLAWIVRALPTLDNKAARHGCLVSTSTLDSPHYRDSVFLGGCLSPSDLEDGMLIYTHLWNGYPIAMLKTNYVADYLAARNGLSHQRAMFFCRHFRVLTTMHDGMTHIYIRHIVVGETKWWVWSSTAAGWFACVPPAREDQPVALSTGRFDITVSSTLEFVAFNDFLRAPIDIKRELEADLGAVIELDPLEKEFVVTTPSRIPPRRAEDAVAQSARPSLRSILDSFPLEGVVHRDSEGGV